VVPVLFSCDGSGEGRSEILYRVTFFGGVFGSGSDVAMGDAMRAAWSGLGYGMGGEH
jgi:hypothetical protein